MASLTYRAQTPDDPVFTKVGNYSFEHGKAVEVDDATAERLSGNPWFTGGRAAKKEAAELSGAGNGPRIDSSIDVQYPPGSGMKYAPEAVKTEQGLVPAEDADTDETIGEYEVKHRGRGKFDVLKGGEAVQTGLTKAEAEDWVKARSA